MDCFRLYYSIYKVEVAALKGTTSRETDTQVSQRFIGTGEGPSHFKLVNHMTKLQHFQASVMHSEHLCVLHCLLIIEKSDNCRNSSVQDQWSVIFFLAEIEYATHNILDILY